MYETMLENQNRTWWGAWSCTAVPNLQSLWHFPRWRMFNGVSLSGIHHTLLSTALSITSPPPSYFLVLSPPFLYIPTNKHHLAPLFLCLCCSQKHLLGPVWNARFFIKAFWCPDVTSFQILIPSYEDCRHQPQVLVFACTLIYPSAWAEVDLRMCSAFSSSLNSCLEV